MTSQFWWTTPAENTAQAVFDYVASLDAAQVDLRTEFLRNVRLYANYDPVGLDWKQAGSRRWSRNPTAVSENVVESVIDTATSMIAKNRPRPTFQTDGADWSQQRKAKLLEQFVWGMFQKLDVFNRCVTMFRDGCITGTGIIKIFTENGQIRLERLVPDELIVDEQECRNGCSPRQMHQRKFIDKDVLASMFPAKRGAIEVSATRSATNYTGATKVDSRIVEVLESWRLPSSEGAKDGRHTWSIDGVLLFDEKYTEECFPFVTFVYNEPVTGFWGKGLAAMLVGIQLRIHKLNRFIDECQDLIAVPRVFIDVAGKPPKAQLTDKIGQIVPTRGKPPVFYTPPAVGAETYQRLSDLKRSAYELAGITQLSASGKKPGGIESAVALREYNDIETQRFAIVAQRYEGVFLEIAKHIVRLAKKLNASGADVTTVYADRSFAKKIDWKDVDLGEDVFTMSIEAASIMSRTPAGRLQAVVEMMQAGLVQAPEGRRLLGHPDLQREMEIQNAAIDDIEAAIENLLSGVWEQPRPNQDLQRGLLRMQQAELKGYRDKVPEENLDLVRRWMAIASDMLQKAAQPPAAPGGANMETPASAMAPTAMDLQAGRGG